MSGTGPRVSELIGLLSGLGVRNCKSSPGDSVVRPSLPMIIINQLNQNLERLSSSVILELVLTKESHQRFLKQGFLGSSPRYSDSVNLGRGAHEFAFVTDTQVMRMQLHCLSSPDVVLRYS